MNIPGFVSNPVVQQLGTMAIKQIIEAFGDKKDDKKDHSKDVEKLRKEVEGLRKENEAKNSELLEVRDKELKKTNQRNTYLQNEVNKLRRKLEQEQKAGVQSSELLKQNEEQIASLQKEMEEAKTLKEEKESEIEEIKIDCETQKKDMEEFNTLVGLLAAKVSAKNKQSDDGPSSRSDDDPSTTSQLATSEIVSKLTSLLDACTVDVEKKVEKKKRTKKNKKNKKDPNIKDANCEMEKGNPAGPQQHMQTEHFLPGGQQTPSSFNNMPPTLTPYGMVGPSFMNMGGPHSMTGPSLMNMGPTGISGPYNPTQNQFMVPPINMGPPHSGFIPPLFMNPPIPIAPPAPLPFNSNNHQWNHNQTNPQKPNVVNKPNNFEKKKNAKVTNSTKETENKKENNLPGANTTKTLGKSGPIKDLWSQLEELKPKIPQKDSNRSQLTSEVTTLMREASKSDITSKDNFLRELSECLVLINKIPDKNEAGSSKISVENQRRNYKTDFKKKNQHKKEFSNNRQSDEDNCSDETSSTCSETPQNTSFKGGKGEFKTSGGNRKGQQGGKINNFVRNISGGSSDGIEVDLATKAKEDNPPSSGSNPIKNKPQNNNNKPTEGKAQKNDKKNKPQDNDNKAIEGKAQKSDKKNKPQDNDNKAIEGKVQKSDKKNKPQDNGNKPIEGKAQKGDNKNKPQDNDNKPTEGKAQKGDKKKKSQSNVNKSMEVQAQKETDVKGDSSKEMPEKVTGYASEDILDQFIGHDIPSLTNAIMKKIDLNLKVKNCIMVTTRDGRVINERPRTLLDIIQFKKNYPDACISKDFVN